MVASYSVLSAGTHLIQNLRSHTNETTLFLEITFVENASLWGAHVAMEPHMLNRNTCLTYTRRNFQKPVTETVLNTSISIENLPVGVYNLSVYVVESRGTPDGDSVPVRPSQEVLVERELLKVECAVS